MKKLLVLLMLLHITMVFGQKFEKIKALKTGFITDRLELTPSEAEKFWPVYNLYEKELFQLQVVDKKNIFKEIANLGGLDKLNDLQSTDMLKKISKLQNEIHETEAKKIEALRKIIPDNKILKLLQAEEAFRKELFRLLKDFKRGAR